MNTKYLILNIVISLLITSSIFAQNQKVKKSELNKIFRKSIAQDSRKTISTPSNPWVIDNTDSLFFKTDTVKLINIHKQYQYDFCEKINWSFYRKAKFYQVESQECREPASGKISDENSRHWITIKRTDVGLVLTTYNLLGIVDQFLVLSIVQNETKDEILLKRFN